MWLLMGEEEGAPLVYFHQVKHMWVGYADGRSGTVWEEEEAGERQATAHGKEGGAKIGGAVDADAEGCAGSGVCGQHEQNSRGVGAHEAGLGHGTVRWGDSAAQQRHGQRVGLRHRDAPDAQDYDHG